MRQIILLISLLSLAACGGFGIKKTDVAVHIENLEIPRIDCRPYPKPDLFIMGDIEPQSREDGWFISHEDYKKLSNMWDITIRYMTQTRSIVGYFVDCINQHNRLIEDYNRQ